VKKEEKEAKMESTKKARLRTKTKKMNAPKEKTSGSFKNNLKCSSSDSTGRIKLASLTASQRTTSIRKTPTNYGRMQLTPSSSRTSSCTAISSSCRITSW
jgi:hypothetical protein